MVYGWCTDVDGWGTDGALKMCVDGAQMVSSCARMGHRWGTDGVKMGQKTHAAQKTALLLSCEHEQASSCTL